MNPLASNAYRLAEAGRIDESAPAKATGEIEIAADRATVWQLLANVKNWPRIRSDVTGAEVIGYDGSGRFRWLAGGIPVESAFACSEQPERLHWANVAPGMEMAAVYTFEECGPNRTRVHAAESMKAAAVAPHIDDAALEAGIQSWLEGLKQLAEVTAVDPGTR